MLQRSRVSEVAQEIELQLRLAHCRFTDDNMEQLQRRWSARQFVDSETTVAEHEDKAMSPAKNVVERFRKALKKKIRI